MSTSYSAIDIAKAIITEIKNQDSYINITKLQKLLYIVYGVYLVEENQELFNEEPLCLPFGPVFDSVLQSYKQNELELQDVSNSSCNIDENIQNTIERVVRGFGTYDARTLSEWSHRKGSAWYYANNESNIWGNQIKKEYIKAEFIPIVKS